MKKNTFFALAIILLPLFGMSQWQADMLSSISGGEQAYKVYSDLHQYRYELTQDGKNLAVIVKPDENKTAILLVDDKKVHFTTTDGMMSRMNDPVQAYHSYKKYGEEKQIGEEEVNGFNCIKKAIFNDDGELFSMWFSEDLNFPVKLVGHWAENTYMQLSAIADWRVDKTLFAIPEDFIEVDEELRPVIPEPPPPQSWEKTETSLPVNMDAKRGMALSFYIDEDVHYKVHIENTGDTPARFIFHEFINGKERSEDEQGPLEWRMRRLYMEEHYNMTFAWKTGFTILFEFYEGTVHMQVEKVER
jgi:hypothetical protein